jgi:hypothetical protein
MEWCRSSRELEFVTPSRSSLLSLIHSGMPRQAAHAQLPLSHGATSTATPPAGCKGAGVIREIVGKWEET